MPLSAAPPAHLARCPLCCSPCALRSTLARAPPVVHGRLSSRAVTRIIPIAGAPPVALPQPPPVAPAGVRVAPPIRPPTLNFHFFSPAALVGLSFFVGRSAAKQKRQAPRKALGAFLFVVLGESVSQIRQPQPTIMVKPRLCVRCPDHLRRLAVSATVRFWVTRGRTVPTNRQSTLLEPLIKPLYFAPTEAKAIRLVYAYAAGSFEAQPVKVGCTVLWAISTF